MDRVRTRSGIGDRRVTHTPGPSIGPAKMAQAPMTPTLMAPTLMAEGGRHVRLADFRRRCLTGRRLAILALVAATVAGLLWGLADVIFADRASALGIAIVIAVAVPLTMIALSFWSALAGMVLILMGRRGDRVVLPVPEGRTRLAPAGRTAIAMPIYHEDPRRVIRGLEATLRSLDETGEGDRFDLFVLSDTRDGPEAKREQAAIDRWRQAQDRPGRIVYRRRRANTGRKAGNIADFCRRWGDRYDYLLILDADSIMDGATIVRLARLMDANPQAGLIQATPLIARQTTLFGRLMQFGARIAMHPLSMGMAFWFGSESNYYGHNAIIRMAPFKRHCHLPEVRGLGPLNGEILSHDFVEAAFMRRAGYEVWLLPVSEGSYEEMPPDLPGYLKRDRRWCNGNLQHIAILFQPGLHSVSRIHLLIGIVNYLAAPLWLLLIGAACWSLFAAPEIVAPALNDPDVPTVVDKLAALAPKIWMLAVIAILLIAPRLLGAATILARPETRRRYGGAARFSLGVAAEVSFMALLAPVLMMARTSAIVGILAGKSSGWEPQNRAGGGISWAHGLRSQAVPLALGVAMTAFVVWIEPAALVWFLPVVVGLLLAVPATVLSAREDIGLATVRWGLFQMPEEQQPTDVTALEAAQTNRADKQAASIAA